MSYDRNRFFVSQVDGSLVRYSDGKVVRPRYAYTFTDIKTTHELRATLRAGPYAWPGGYPMYLITDDGACLHFDCVRANYRSVADAIRHKLHDGWRVVACDINYEDNDLECDFCNERIESAYGDDDTTETEA